MNQASAGQTVRIHYNAKLENGTLLDTSAQRDPMEFELGSGQVISGLDNAVQGMTVGESKTVTIVADDAYGQRNEQLIISVPNSELPDNLQPTVGMELQSRAPDGHITKLTITEVGDDSITVDANHPLAGQVLQFDIELVEIA
jgi:peptidylprolyl isomerase